MTYDDALTDRLGTALNEAEVAGMVADEAAGTVRVRYHVLALPESGPRDADTRRAVVLSGVSAVRVLLRREEPRPPGAIPYGPALDLAGLDALNAFIGGVYQRHAQYGWRFIDAEEELTWDWPEPVSHELTWGAADAPHSLYWFTECLVRGPAAGTYCAEGLVRFTDLAVERADGAAVPVAAFAADGERWWRARDTGDRRVSADAQRAAPPSPPWPNEPPAWPGWSVIV